MPRQIPAPTLRAMLRRYEKALRRLVDDADDEARLYAHQQEPDHPTGVTPFDIARHDAYRKMRKVAAYALHEFHPEISVEAE